MRIGENFSYHVRPLFPDPSRASRKAIMETYVLTHETGELLRRVLERLAPYPAPQLGSLFLTGHAGVGKTHAVRFLAGLLEAPQDPAWKCLQPLIGSTARPTIPLSNLYISLPEDPMVDLGRFLLQRICHRSNWDDGLGAEIRVCEIDDKLRDAASGFREQALGFVAVDDFSRRAVRLDSEKLKREIHILEIVTNALCDEGVLVLLVGAEKHLRQREMGAAQEPSPTMRRPWDPIRIRRNTIAEVVSKALASKDDAQRERIRAVLNVLRRRLPQIGFSIESLSDLYPINPYIFPYLFRLREVLPNFSPLQFAQIAIKAARTRPAEHLVGIDMLFDFILPDLEARKGHRDLLASYEEFLTTVMPQLKPSIQQKAGLLLKAITFFTICEGTSPNVISLANAVLLSDDKEVLPSYCLAAALLMELEQYGGRLMIVSGALRERCYRLKRSDAGPKVSSPERLLEQDEFRAQFPLMLYEWIQSKIPAWKPDTSSKYQQCSQSLQVQVPGLEKGSVGIVHFKSVSDPLWSVEDLTALRENPYQWVLLIINPLERFYEFDRSLQELASSSAEMLIWRPDRPKPEEIERLHALSLLASETRPREAQFEMQQILTSLYVRRGRFLSGSREWLLADTMDNQELQDYLFAELQRLTSPTAPEGAAIKPVRQRSQAAPVDGDPSLDWVAMLTGMAGTRKMDQASATNELLSWWATHLDLDPVASYENWPELPEAFLTTDFTDDVRFFKKRLDLIRPVLQQLHAGDIDFLQAMKRIMQCFSMQEAELTRWTKLLGDLPALLRWLPSFKHAQTYLTGAFATNQERIEQMRRELLASVEKPRRLLESSERDSFERRFLEFKNDYTDYYEVLHESRLPPANRREQTKLKVDSVALRNLEMLSSLQYTNKSYLNRVRIIGKWIQANQCRLPVREILARHPRCYCNFDPSGSRDLGDLADQVNELIHEAVGYFRTILRRCSGIIIQELKQEGVDDYHSKQIAALLSRGPMVPLRPRSIEILNGVIERHSQAFLAEIRKT